MAEKRILIVTRNFPPLIGGMERLLFNAYKQLGKEYICDVVGPTGCSMFIEKPHRAHECSSRYVSTFLLTALIKCINLCLRNKYKLVFTGSGVTTPISIIISKLFSSPSLSYIHGLDLIVQNLIYQKIFIPCIRKQSTVVANSKNTARLARKMGISAVKINVLNPGVRLPQVVHDSGADFIKKYALQNRKILLSVGRLVPRKGIVEFIENCLPQIIAACPESIFIIIGSEPKDALKKSENLSKKIEALVKQLELNGHVLLLANVDDKTLEAAYGNAEIFVFPLLETPGDIEGFGMVAVEAASYGVPTIGFSGGGLPDAVQHGVSGLLIDLGRYDEMAQEIIGQLQDENKKLSKKSCLEHAGRFTWDKFGKRLREICALTIESYNLTK